MKTCEKCGSDEFDKRGKCKACRREYAAKYRAKNAEWICAYQKQYFAAHLDEVDGYRKKYRKKNHEKIKVRYNVFKKANPDKIIAYRDAWAKANPDKVAAASAVWSVKHSEARRAIGHRYRARVRASGESFTKKDIYAMMKQQNGKCVVCRVDISKKYHIDHIMPLILGGSNGKENIQLLCPHCNLTKGAKHPNDFMPERMQVKKETNHANQNNSGHPAQPL